MYRLSKIIRGKNQTVFSFLVFFTGTVCLLFKLNFIECQELGTWSGYHHSSLFVCVCVCVSIRPLLVRDIHLALSMGKQSKDDECEDEYEAEYNRTCL